MPGLVPTGRPAPNLVVVVRVASAAGRVAWAAAQVASAADRLA
jgi:hypothetical protein